MGITILVAEDDEDDRQLLDVAMKEARIENRVKMVEDGREAMAYLRGLGGFGNREEFPFPSLLLLDLKMPYKDGFEVLEEARADEIFRSLPIIVLTASSQPQDIERAYRLKANAYLVKPTTMADLRQMMEAIKLFWLRFNQFPASLILPPACG